MFNRKYDRTIDETVHKEIQMILWLLIDE